MFSIKSFSIASLFLLHATTASFSAPKVVTSIKPIHSLAASVMGEVGKPALLVGGASSPHSFSLKPSQGKLLQEADLIFWVGHELETFLEKPLETLTGNGRPISLIDADGIRLIKFRELDKFGVVDAHDDHDDHAEHEDHDDHAKHEDHDDHAKHEDHDDHAKHEDHDDHAKHEDHDDHAKHEDHDDHAKHEEHDDHAKHEDHDDHAKHEDHDDHAKHEEAGHGHDHAHDHAGGVDPHIWLDPENAKIILVKIRDELSRLDADNAAIYAKNTEAALKQISALDEQLVALTDPVKNMKFVVFHDAYNYFETRYGLAATAALRISADVAPGAKNVQRVRELLEKSDVGCIFTEPQFNSKIIDNLADGLNVNVGLIDPLGAGLDDGAGLYNKLMHNVASSFSGCLSASN
ncbi:zinc ABC transporter substrate-binding protein [Lentilitoribacter sp. Alg239-R112]|uniref:zinc ABC transporter substrate-binding protein n=1 Tax=Lentilitoribacter sp. Alg239-R112 TaxID=2305987 RepID=UPI0018D8893C|nr:zinc ABC transporter substrate-binding protein [Lentilitoribacter sp. Alg239-R112]